MSVLLAACIVTAVYDGDTLTAKCEKRASPVRVRVAGIDSPELKAFTWQTQPGAIEARTAARTLCLKQKAVIRLDVYDRRTSRWVGRVVCQGQDLGKHMVSGGNAWAYMPTKTADYSIQMRGAQDQRIGLWNGEAVSPAAWRKLVR